MSDLLIRPAVTADISAISTIYRDAVLTGTASFEIEPPAEAEMVRRYSALCDAGYPYLVAEEAGIVLGYGYAGPYHSRPGYRNTVEDSVYLLETARGRGVGSAILGQLIGECEARDFRQMIAIIGDSSHIASIRLHEAAGFAHVGTLKDVGYKHGRWLDSVLMQRPLGPGGEAAPSR
jgi:L-amino acid N-acyltransferase YncA